MSDEPLIFEHTSDEPEQNGFPLDTADLPLDSVDSSDSEEDVNQLLDLISKDYTNEDEDDEEEPLVYDDDSSDNEESYLQEPEVSLFSEDDDESVFEDDKEEKGDKANTSLDDIFNDALSAIQFEDSGKKEESEPEAIPSDIQGDLEEPPVQMVETAEPEKELKQAKGDGFWKRTFGNIITEQSAEEEQKERELEEADAKKKAELKAETKKQQEKEREEKAEEKQKIAEQKNLEKAEKKEKKRLAKEEKKQRKAELAAAEVVGKINPVGATIVMVFFGVVCLSVLLGSKIFSYSSSINNAGQEFENRDYKAAYEALAGVNVSKSSEELKDKVRICMQLQRELDSYNNYYKMKMYLESLDALAKGIRSYDENKDKADTYEIMTQYNELEAKLAEALYNEFGVTETQIRDIINNSKNQEEYTAKLQAIIDSWQQKNREDER